MVRDHYDIENSQRTEEEIGALRQVWTAQAGCRWNCLFLFGVGCGGQHFWVKACVRSVGADMPCSCRQAHPHLHSHVAHPGPVMNLCDAVLHIWLRTRQGPAFPPTHAPPLPRWCCQVSVDVPRTAPNVPFFHEPVVQQSLERLLYIWGIRCVHHCQLLTPQHRNERYRHEEAAVSLGPVIPAAVASLHRFVVCLDTLTHTVLHMCRLPAICCRHPASGYVQGMNDLVTPFVAVCLSEVLEGQLSTWSADSLTEVRQREWEASSLQRQHAAARMSAGKRPQKCRWACF